MKVKFELQYHRTIFTVVTVVLRYLHYLKHSVAIFRDTVTRLGSKWPQSNSASFIPFGFLCQINRLGFIAVTVDTVVLKKPNFQNIFIFLLWSVELEVSIKNGFCSPLAEKQRKTSRLLSYWNHASCRNIVARICWGHWGSKDQEYLTAGFNKEWLETLNVPDCNGEDNMIAKSLVLRQKLVKLQQNKTKMRDWMSSDFGNRMHEKVIWNLEKNINQNRYCSYCRYCSYNMN